MAWHYNKQGFMFFWSFLIFWNLNAMALHAYICMCPCLKIPSNLLHMELNPHTSTQIWFFKPLWLAIACRLVQIWIMIIKWLENQLNVFKRSNDPWNFPNFHMTVVLVHVTRRNFLKAIRGSYLPFVIKHALSPLGTMSLLVSCSGLWGVCVQTFVTHAKFFTTSSWWHDITSTKVSCVSEFFWN